MSQRTRSDKETWETLSREIELDRATAEIEAMTEDEVDQELRERGIDPENVRAKARLQAEAARAMLRGLERRRVIVRRSWMAIAASAAVVLLVVWASTLRSRVVPDEKVANPVMDVDASAHDGARD
jgi:hypothetical protein